MKNPDLLCWKGMPAAQKNLWFSRLYSIRYRDTMRTGRKIRFYFGNGNNCGIRMSLPAIWYIILIIISLDANLYIFMHRRSIPIFVCVSFPNCAHSNVIRPTVHIRSLWILFDRIQSCCLYFIFQSFDFNSWLYLAYLYSCDEIISISQCSCIRSIYFAKSINTECSE